MDTSQQPILPPPHSVPVSHSEKRPFEQTISPVKLPKPTSAQAALQRRLPIGSPTPFSYTTQLGKKQHCTLLWPDQLAPLIEDLIMQVDRDDPFQMPNTTTTIPPMFAGGETHHASSPHQVPTSTAQQMDTSPLSYTNVTGQPPHPPTSTPSLHAPIIPLLIPVIHSALTRAPTSGFQPPRLQDWAIRSLTVDTQQHDLLSPSPDKP
ncbi:hypothetical protein BDQ17DRAFT_1336836 [Cyathus striatus]|nr:hypothetical protein BDQ17DRAFT_1336836 [Cyathus striatus]